MEVANQISSARVWVFSMGCLQLRWCPILQMSIFDLMQKQTRSFCLSLEGPILGILQKQKVV